MLLLVNNVVQKMRRRVTNTISLYKLDTNNNIKVVVIQMHSFQFDPVKEVIFHLRCVDCLDFLIEIMYRVVQKKVYDVI